MRRERVVALWAAVLIVVVRSLPYALFERIQFDSDQAILGLMTKHLAEGRAFPLFIYGQSYMLAVEAWITAPLFLIGPHTLFVLSLPLILINVATAVLLILTLERSSGLRPLHAFAASTFFLVPPPIVAGDFVSVSGGQVEPFLYVTLLWIFRHQPVWFGAILAIGFLHREFTVYAVPVLLLADVVRRRLITVANIRRWLLAGVMFLAVWEGVQALQPYADLMGPGTRGELLGGAAGSQISNAISRINIDVSEMPSRVDGMLSIHLPRILGSTAYRDHRGRRRPWIELFLTVGFGAAVIRAAMVLVARGYTRGLETAAFSWYLIGVGVIAGTVFLVAHHVSEEFARYGLLMLLIPIGLVGVLLALDPGVWSRRVVVAGVVAWALIPVIDTARLYSRFTGRPPGDFRVLADALVARRVRSAYADYWTAYVVTFIAGERVKIASTDFVRIDEYQRIAGGTPGVVVIRNEPCPEGEKVARWYLCGR